MGIKSFFRNLGRGIKRGWNSFTTGAGNIMGNAGTYLQQKVIPAIAKGASSISGLIGKATPLIEGVGGPEAGALAGEAGQVAGKVGDVVGKFADYIGSNAKAGRMATPDEVNAFRASIPQGKTFFGIKPLPPAPAPAQVSAPAPSLISKFNTPKGLISPAPLGSNPNTYTPKPMNSGIEAPPAVPAPSIIKIGNGTGGTTPLLG